MDSSGTEWVKQKSFEEHHSHFRNTWTIYFQFYVVWLTVNVTAIGLAAQYGEATRLWPICLAFVVQNVLAAFAGLQMVRYSKKTEHEADDLANTFLVSEAGTSKLKSGIPITIAVYAGWANFVSCLTLGIIWYTMWLMR